MPPEDFERRKRQMRERTNWRYHNDPEYRKRADEKNRSEDSKRRKRNWNKRNRAYLSEYTGMRRAKERGQYVELSKDEKKRVCDWYAFRDVLNKVHGKIMFHIDHKVAIARGGPHHPDNLQVTTKEYNVRKFVNAAPKTTNA